MNSSLIRANAVRFILFVLIQGFVLRGVDMQHVQVYLYPLFILMLPLGLADGLLLLICFLFGLSIDAFYDTLGLHASAAVLLGGIRNFILAFLEPRGGYDAGKAVTKVHLGITWFMQYSAIMLLIHSVWVSILSHLELSSLTALRIVVVFAISFLIVILYQFIFNPKE